MQGEEFSFDSVSVGGQRVFHSISEYYPTPLEVMEQPWIQWCVLLPRSIDTPQFADILRIGPRATSGWPAMAGRRRPDMFFSFTGSKHSGQTSIGWMSCPHDWC